MITNSDTRQRLVRAMQHALATKGFHGFGLTELLADAQAPKGVLYHHFPGGKTELALAALAASTEFMLSQLDKVTSSAQDPSLAITAWFENSRKLLSAKNYELGCPLATVALETTADDIALRQAIANSFSRLRATLAQVLEAANICNPKPIAALIVSSYEGALMQARVAQSPKPLRDTLTALLPLLKVQKHD
jgi:TetR/AcrR family transcriptional regulator, lmrAB and yxaGH operons repressor